MSGRKNKFTKNNVLFVVILLCSLVFMSATFQVGLTVVTIGVSYNYSGFEQVNKTVFANESNVSLQIPIVYDLPFSQNVSLNFLSGWESGFNWYLFENGFLINSTINTTGLQWKANATASSVMLRFKASPPEINITSELATKPYYELNVTIQSPTHFVNVTASVPVQENYTLYNLYWFNGSSFVDRTLSYTLQIANGTATFSGFNTSNQYFSLQGYCEENWICTSWSDDGCGSRTCTDQNNCTTTVSKPATFLQCNTNSGAGANTFFTSVVTENKTNLSDELIFIPQSFSITVNQGQTEFFVLFIKNNQEKITDATLRLNPLDSLLQTNISLLRLAPLQQIRIPFSVQASNVTPPGDYYFDVFAKSKSTVAVATVLVTVANDPFIFNLSLEKNPLLPRDSLTINYSIFNSFNESIQSDVLFYLRDDEGVRKILGRDKIFVNSFNASTLAKSFSVESSPGVFEVCADSYIEKKVFTICNPVSVAPFPLKEEPVLLSKNRFKSFLIFIGFLLLLALLLVILEHRVYRLFSKKRNDNAPDTMSLKEFRQRYDAPEKSSIFKRK